MCTLLQGNSGVGYSGVRPWLALSLKSIQQSGWRSPACQLISGCVCGDQRRLLCSC